VYVTAIRVEGLRGAPSWERPGLGRVVDLPPGPEGVAVADALTLLSASMDGRRLHAALVRLGLSHPADDPEIVEEHGLPTQVWLSDVGGVKALVRVEEMRNFTVYAEIEPDPPLFGRLRELAVRDPRLVTALGQSPTIRVKVGWLLSNDHTTAAIGLSEVGIGEVAFALSSAERPIWLPGLLRDLGARFGRTDPVEPGSAVTARLLEASLSSDGDVRHGFRKVANAVAGPPFSLGRLELVRAEGRLHACFGPELLRARQFGVGATEALRLAAAVYLNAPDVLIVEASAAGAREPAAVREWLARATQGDDATLEQVILVPGGSP